MSIEGYLLLVLAGLAAGILNTLAGGGSLLTLPALIFLGLDANVANGTNRVGVLLQNVASVSAFARRGRMPWGAAGRFIPLTVAGALVGARIAVQVPAPILRAVLGAVILIALPAVFMSEGRAAGAATSRRPEAERSPQSTRRRALVLQLACLGIGLYGGFIQAGVGFLILGALVPLAGFDLVRANAIKVLIVLLHTAIALPVFLLNRQVVILPGLVLAVGQMTGGWIGAHLGVQKGAGFVRWVLLAALVISAAQLLAVPARVMRWLGG
jgi:uncharacterized membrane protein YfcA